MQNILIVEDDMGLREGIVIALRREELFFVQCGSIEEAMRELKSGYFDLVLLDINLPDGNGYDLLKEIKNRYDSPVILLTANDLEMDEVKGLELGAEDYITKPFSLMVLRARISKVLRAEQKDNKTRYRFGELDIDFAAGYFAREGQEIVLSRTEQKLLQYLIDNQGILLTREKLIDHIWDGTEYVEANALSVTVNRLRSKLEKNPASPVFLHTVYGQGYIWKDK